MSPQKPARRQMSGSRPGAKVGLVAAIAPILGAILAAGDGQPYDNGGAQYQYDAVCTDRYGVRVDDVYCRTSPIDHYVDGWDFSSPYGWYYEPTGTANLVIVPIGGRVSGGTYSAYGMGPKPPGVTTRLPGGAVVVRPPANVKAVPRIASVERGVVPRAGGTVIRGGFGVSGGKGGSGS